LRFSLSVFQARMIGAIPVCSADRIPNAARLSGPADAAAATRPPTRAVY